MAQDGQIGRKNKWPNHHGSIMVDSVRGSLRVRKWPRRRPTVHPTVAQQMSDFTQANILWRYIHPEIQKTFINAARGTPWLPRDWFLKTLYGTALSIVNPENNREYFSMATRQAVSDSLKAISQDVGALLTWNGTLYVPIKPVSAGQVLTSQGADQLPAWAPPGSVGDYPLTPPDLSDFGTWVNQGNAVAEDGPLGLCFSGQNAAAHSVRARVKTLAASPSNYVFGFNLSNITGGFSSGGIALRDSATGRLVTWGVQQQTQTAPSVFIVRHMNSPTSNNSDVITQANTQVGNVFFRVVDDGSNFRFQYSQGGAAWIELYFESRTAWLASPNQVGPHINPYGSTCAAAFFHFDQS